MSVILENNQKFCDIFEALRRREKILKYFFYEFAGTDEIPLESRLALFVGQLHRANVASYNERYGAEEPERVFDLIGMDSAGARWTDLELIKALQSINYQNSESERTGPEMAEIGERLRKMIYALMESVISKIPGYDQARTW